MTEIYLHFLCAHYGLYGNESLTPCDAQVVAAGPAPAGSALERQKRAVAVAGVRAFFQMVLRDNFVHADLHPGNIFVRGWQGKQQRHVNSLQFHGSPTLSGPSVSISDVLCSLWRCAAVSLALVPYNGGLFPYNR